MEWVFVVLLVLAVPIGLAIWLIARTIDYGNRFEEISRRVSELERELFRLKSEAEPTPEAKYTPPAERAEILQRRQTGTPVVPPAPVVEPPPVISPPTPTVFEPVAVPPPIPVTFATAETAPAPAAPPISPTTPESAPTLTEPPIFAATAEAAAPAIEPPPAASPDVAAPGSFEMRLGTFWLVRVGAVMLLTGLAFFGNLAYQSFSAGGKVALLYLASGLLLGAGAWWQRKVVKESLRNYAQVLFAGGLAAVYFTTYAAHHIAQLRVIESAVLDGVLLLAWAGFMAWIADRKKSEVLALFAVGLAYYTGVITQVGAFTLYSNLVLTLAAVFFLVRNRWAGLSFASLGATYASYAFWRFFHGGEWHWATPDEGLWLGAYFLMSYWLVFTAAVFLSKHEKLAGEYRAGFLTFNNGAFFTLFLLTMLQVHQGGFWKFSLSYGLVLLALTELARRLLPDEPLAKNSYLTQGLLLVTLGFIAKFAGLQLALVLAVESVVLFVLGTQRRSLILQIAASLAAALAVGWGCDGLQPNDERGLWLGSALGALMAFNSFWAHRQTTAEGDTFRSVPAYFAALALGVWCFTTWQNTTHANFGLILTIEALLLTLSLYVLRVPELTLLGQSFLLVAQAAWVFDVPHNTSQLTALVLAVDGFVLLQLGWRRKTLAWRMAGYLAAALAVAWGVNGLSRDDTAGLLTGLALAAMMILKSFLAHREDAGENQNPLRAEPAYFSLLTVVLVLATTWFNTSPANYPIALAAEALLLTASVYLLRVRELALFGQTLLLAGHCAWQFNLFEHGAPPWWNPLLMIGMTLGLAHWWQRQKVIVPGSRVPQAFQFALALLFVLLACTWLGRECSNETWLALSCLLAVAVTVYAAATRAWLLAACAQLFLLPGAWLFLQQVSHAGEPRFGALAPIAALGALSFAALQWFRQKPDADPRVRDPLLMLAMAYRWMALVMSLWWVMEYIPHREQIWTLMLIGLVVFLFAGWRRSREALLFGGAFSGLAVLLLWVRSFEPAGNIYLPSGLAILALLAQQQGAKHLPERFKLDARIHTAVIVIGTMTLWRFISCWIMQHGGGYLTVSWSVLALALFGYGIGMRERIYRWVGLGVLAGALGRVVLVDVWKQETIYRVLTFTALGVVLLVVGFIYNKYQEKIRLWL